MLIVLRDEDIRRDVIREASAIVQLCNRYTTGLSSLASCQNFQNRRQECYLCSVNTLTHLNTYPKLAFVPRLKLKDQI